ncbi:MAG TPA: alkaline phosphatase family protein [Blastocatellia bacterium]|nr:alkaline phosphatase family protein [Blastocatellia bacterium]
MLLRNWLCILLAALTLASNAAPALPQAREGAKGGSRPGMVVYVSLDGLAYYMWAHDPVTRELRSLRSIAARGVEARGAIQSFPSITPAGHAALWTGAYGDISGVITAGNPILPRGEHTAFERVSGFDSRALHAEPIWVTAARNGTLAVAHQATQNHPFIPFVTAPSAEVAPVLLSGYGPEPFSPHAVIRSANVSPEDPDGWRPALPYSSLPVRAFQWKTGKLTFHGALVADQGSARSYNAIYVAADRTGPRVRVALAPTERDYPRGRRLARSFSDGLKLSVGDEAKPAVAYFRLFELAPDGSDFFLYQPAIHELAFYDGSDEAGAALRSLLEEAGGFIGNGPSYMYRDGGLGRTLFEGGDGTAERRYLEAIELIMRQYNRHSEWLVKRYSPRLLIDYSPYPDEMEHTWYGLARPDITGVDQRVARRIQEFRRWGYQALDQRVALLDRLAGSDGHIIFSSDHGMSPIAKEVKVNLILRNAGLLSVNEKGGVDTARTQAIHLKYCVLVNTLDWRGGIVRPEDRKKIVDRAEQALRQVKDPETGAAVFTQFFRPGESADPPGIGGPAGGDLYFELAPGYAASDALIGDVIVRTRVPNGQHGFLSTRPEMLASFIARGPRIKPSGTIQTIYSIDIASLVTELLGIPAPAQNQGKSPIRLKDGA